MNFFIEYLSGGEQNVGGNMEKVHPDEVLDEESNSLESGEKATLIAKQQRIWLTCACILTLCARPI
jgi:hypothetical protein